MLKAVMAQISRPEYLVKIPRYTEDSGPQIGDELCRFPPVEWQQRSIDVKARDKMMVDEILNNAVFTSLFYGDIMCSFCCSMIGTRDISDVMCHLVTRHKKLVKSWFSCPVCISTTITDWNGFMHHRMRYHSSCLGLIVVLEEANIAARLSMGLALHSWIASCKLMKIWPQKNMDSEIEAPLIGQPLEDTRRRPFMRLNSWRRPSGRTRPSFCRVGWRRRSGGQRLSGSRQS